MKEIFKTRLKISSSKRSRLKDIVKKMTSLDDAIRNDKLILVKIVSPLDFMQIRAEKAETALRASEVALDALIILQKNSFGIIKVGHQEISSMKETIEKNAADVANKISALKELNIIIEKNRISLKASALALSAVNELAFNDVLTGLPNRRLLNDRLQQIIANNKRWETYSAAIFLDLNKFKHLNDEFGHAAGDALLVAVGMRLKIAVRETDTVARYGGDEFVILLDKLNGNLLDAKTEAEIISKKILADLSLPYNLHVRSVDGMSKVIEYQSSASLGVVMFGGDESKENHILDWADEAMYWSKSEGGTSIRFYDAANSTEQTLLDLYNLATHNDIETANHGIRMRQYVKTLAHRARKMNFYPGELDGNIIERLFKTTQLHDIGKTKISHSIINKKEKLSEEEWALIKTHTTCGAKILESAKKQNTILIEFLNMAIDVAKAHHEHWDGSGYPNGLAGIAIPLAGRIIAIADVYDALISKRSYKNPWKHEDAFAEIVSKSGKQFDPFLIKAFMHEQKNFKLIAESARD